MPPTIDIKPLTLMDRQLISGYLKRFPPQISEHTFTNLYVWGQARPVFYCEIGQTLLLLIKAPLASGRPYILFGPPIGLLSVSTAMEALADVCNNAVRLPQTDTEPFIATDCRLREERNHADYVYRTRDLAKLAGRRYAKKRNKIKQCMELYSCEYESISRTNLHECVAMQKKWCQHRDCDLDVGLCNELAAIHQTFDHFDELNLIGGAIRVAGTIQAYTLGERLAPDTAVCHFEKAMPEFLGLGQLINQWFAEFALQGIEFINREQDLGIAGLRQAKESYFPHHLVKKYRVDCPASGKSTNESSFEL